MQDREKWDLEIKPSSSVWSINWGELWRYRDLLFLFVKRDIITVYKQTILGPAWFVLQPVMTTFIFVIVFGNIAGLSTDGLPQVLFYLSGITMWSYFSESLTLTSRTFIENAPIFGKVYFPRIIIPLSKIMSGLVKFAIQFLLFIVVWLYFYYTTDTVHPNISILLLPVIVVVMGVMGLGFGIIISSLTTKYRDLSFLITFGIQLLMYATPVIYPISSIENPLYRFIIQLNPISSLIEFFRYSFMGTGSVSVLSMVYSITFTIVLFFTGMLVFNKVEKNFIDTV